MENVFYTGKVLWSQIDANMHLRHSAYADFAAQERLELLEHLGFDSKLFRKLKIGPILFREELIYMKEVGANDTVSVTCELTKYKKSNSRWSFKQEIYRSDGEKAAVIHVDGAWLDLEQRKVKVLPDELMDVFMRIPKSGDYHEE